MIRKLNIIFLLIGLLSNAQIYNTENGKIKGKVKSIDLSVIEYDREKFLEQQTFDIKGRTLVLKSFYDGHLGREERNEYKSNQIITTICESCNDFDKAFSKFSLKENQKHTYSGYVTNTSGIQQKIYKTTDTKGNVLFEKYYNVEGYLISSQKNIYNINSKIVSIENFDNENKLLSYRKCTYNKDGLISEDVNKNETQPEFKLIYFYDNLGRKVMEKNIFRDGISESSYEYLKEKDTVKTLIYSSYNTKEKKIESIELVYPKQKSKIKEKLNFLNDKISSKTISIYDESKNLISQKFYDENNMLIRETQTKYDKIGNWIEINVKESISVRYDNNPPKMELQTKKYIRKIQYYQ